MYINKELTTINTNSKLDGIDEYFFLDSRIYEDKKLIDKFNNYKFPKLIIENNKLIDIVDDLEKNKIKSLEPTLNEIRKAETKIEILNTLQEVELI